MYRYIGKPFACPCDPPNTYDCWELAAEVREALGRRTPLYELPQDRTLEDEYRMDGIVRTWDKLTEPQVGSLVGFGNPVKHVGVMLDNQSVIHVAEGGGGGHVQVHKVKLAARLFGAVSYWELDHA